MAQVDLDEPLAVIEQGDKTTQLRLSESGWRRDIFRLPILRQKIHCSGQRRIAIEIDDLGAFQVACGR